MKSRYDGKWAIIPHGKSECFYLIEWLAEHGHRLGNVSIFLLDIEDIEYNKISKVYFELGLDADYKSLIDYINNNC